MALTIKTLTPLPKPGRVFDDTPGLDSWRSDGESTYVLAVSNPQAAAPSVARALVGAGADLLSLAESRHTLEDVYLELIDHDHEAENQ